MLIISTGSYTRTNYIEGTTVYGIVFKCCSRSQDLPWSSDTLIHIQRFLYNADQVPIHRATIFTTRKPNNKSNQSCQKPLNKKSR